MLAVNRWNETYERVLLGGLTATVMITTILQNMNAIYLPKYNKENHCTSFYHQKQLVDKVYTTA
jgi:hypothetical protein